MIFISLNPSKKIIVTGCAAQIYPLKYNQMSEVDLVIGNNEKMEEHIWKNVNNTNKVQVNNIFNATSTQNHIIEKFEGKSVYYSVKDKTIFKDNTVAIFGGGDSALDWAIELSNNSKIILVHRRDEFRGAQSSVDKVKKLEKDGKLEIYTKYQLTSAKGNTSLESIEIKHEEGEIKSLKANYLLGFFGLIMQLGPILNWGLNLDKKKIPVNTENFETNLKGIFAIGDICMYPGKLKLILSGFHEGALAARGCFKYARPDEKLRFEFTTTSKSVHSRLKVKK